jgi:hypothetical protein
MRRLGHALILLLCAIPRPALACSICGGDFQNRQSLRQAAGKAVVVVFGTLGDARLNPDSSDGQGQTDLRIKRVLKGADLLNGGNFITVPRFFPGDGKSAQMGIFFFEARSGHLAYLSGQIVQSEHVADYVKEVAALKESDPVALLRFFLKRLDHSDAEIADDAFLELVRAGDLDLARAVKGVPIEPLRRMLANPKTPAERIGLCAFLLAIGGTNRDADAMAKMLKQVTAERQMTRRGLVIGLTLLKPKEGWDLIQSTLADPKRDFLERYAILGSLQFFHNWSPKEYRELILRSARLAVESGDLADMAVEDLRRWQWWELTDIILAQYGKPSHDSPIVQRSILRYAMACQQPEAKKFIATIRQRNPALIADVAESLEAENSPGK